MLRCTRLLLLLLAAAGVLGAGGCARRAAGEAVCAEHRFEGDAFLVCAYDARAQQIRLLSHWRGRTLRSFDGLAEAMGADARRVRFAMNAGMFNDVGEAIGLYVERGVERHPLRLTDGPGNFHMKPNGVFSQDTEGAVRIDTSQAFAARAVRPYWATQSGPMLVIGGALHPDFTDNGASRLIRNGVGVHDAHTAYFVISSSFVSFGRFARFFRDRLHCPNALFLDGGVSSLWAPSMARMDRHHAIGPMLAVLDD